MATEFDDGVWYVDLAPIAYPELVPVTTARALGMTDQPGRSAMDTLIRTIGARRMLVVVDNCEHAGPTLGPSGGRPRAGFAR
jgi:predicted ATPase